MKYLIAVVILLGSAAANAATTVKGSKSNSDNITSVFGQSDAECPCPSPSCDTPIRLFDCGGTDDPPICFNDNDVELGSAQDKGIDGGFRFDLPMLLNPGQVIYATDSCFSPLQFSAPFTVTGQSALPLLAWQTIGGLAVLLGLVGVVRLRRVVW